MVTVALDVSPDGTLERLRWLSDTLVVPPESAAGAGEGADPAAVRADILRTIKEGFVGLRLAPAEGKSCITLPLVFGQA